MEPRKARPWQGIGIDSSSSSGESSLRQVHRISGELAACAGAAFFLLWRFSLPPFRAASERGDRANITWNSVSGRTRAVSIWRVANRRRLIVGPGRAARTEGSLRTRCSMPAVILDLVYMSRQLCQVLAKVLGRHRARRASDDAPVARRLCCLAAGWHLWTPLLIVRLFHVEQRRRNILLSSLAARQAAIGRRIADPPPAH